MKKLLSAFILIASTTAFGQGNLSKDFDNMMRDQVREHPTTREEIPICLKWDWNEQCGIKKVCSYTCLAVGGGLGSLGGKFWSGAAIAVGTQLCGELCENVKDCQQMKYCSQWSTSPGS